MLYKQSLSIALALLITTNSITMDAPPQSLVHLNLSGIHTSKNPVRELLTNLVLKKKLCSQKKLDSQQLGINAVLFSPDSSCITSAYSNLYEPTVKTWSLLTNAHQLLPKNDDIMYTKCIAFDSASTTLLCGAGKKLFFYDTEKWKLIKTISLNTTSDVNALAFSKDGNNILLGCQKGENNLNLLIQETDSSFIYPFPGHASKTIAAVGFSPNNRNIVSLCDNELIIWDISAKKAIHKITGSTWSDCKIEYNKNNEWFVTGYDHNDGIMGYWFLYNLDNKSQVIIPLKGKILSQVKTYERSGNYVFLGDAQTSNINIFNICTGQYVHTITSEHNYKAPIITCSSDGKLMATTITTACSTDLFLYNLMSYTDLINQELIDKLSTKQQEFIAHLLSKIDSSDTLDEEKEDNGIFYTLPMELQTLLREHVISPEEQDFYDFTLID